MKCQYCGAELPNGHFCANCGKPVPTKPASFQTEQRIPTPQRQPIQPPQQPIQPQVPPQLQPQPQQVMTQKKKRNPGVIVAIVLGALLAAALAVFLVLRVLGGSGDAEPARRTGDSDDQIQQLTRYAKSKVWLADCGMRTGDLESLCNNEQIRYYLYDFNRDGARELAITVYDRSDAYCLLYAIADKQITLLDCEYYYTDDDMSVNGVELAARENYEGLALQFALHTADDDYPCFSVLQLDSDGLQETDNVAGTDECAALVDEAGWQFLSGTAITALDGNRISDLTAEELAALTELYDPDKPEQEMNLMLLYGTVYAVEQRGLYYFVGQQKQTICTAPEGTIFKFAAGYVPYDGSIYLLGLVDQADETQETVVLCADIRTSTLETLFTVPDGMNILKVDSQYIYVQTMEAGRANMGQVVAYDRSGSAAKTFITPREWSADSATVTGKDIENSSSVVTADGQYLLENVAAQSVRIIDGSVYYLTGSDTSATLYYLTAAGGSIAVGTVPGTGASFRQQAGEWLVAVYDDDGQRTYYDLELEKIYSEAEVKAQIPEAVSISFVDFEYDDATGDIYLVTAYAPHGNSGPLYRLKNGQYELLRNEEEEIFYWMFHDNMVYYGYKDYSNHEPYMQAPTVAGCISVAELSQREPLG